MIHRPESVPLILDAIGKKLGGLAIRPIHPRAAEPAIRILICGVKGSRAPLKILPGLTLHEANGFTSLAAAIHRGEAWLDDAR